MKDAFKVKKGLNVQPTDPADVVNPEAGDLIVDSTDDNRLKVYDPTSSEFVVINTKDYNNDTNVITLDIDWSLEGIYHKSISTDTSFNFLNDSNGQTILLIVNNTDINPHTVSFPSGVKKDPSFSGIVQSSTESIFTLIKSNDKIYIAEVKELS